VTNVHENNLANYNRLIVRPIKPIIWMYQNICRSW